MNRKLLLAVLVVSFTTTLHAAQCDLSVNDRAVSELNQRMDDAMMSGEDHLVGLVQLERQRNALVSECVVNDQTQNISKSDLTGAKAHVNEELRIKVAELNDSIRLSIENDRIGMATELMMERDLLNLEAKNLIAKIDRLISEI